MNIACVGCKSEIKTTNNNIGLAMKETGYQPLSSHDGEFRWLCPVCKTIAKPVVKALLAVLGNDAEEIYYLHLPSLLELLK